MIAMTPEDVDVLAHVDPHARGSETMATHCGAEIAALTARVRRSVRRERCRSRRS